MIIISGDPSKKNMFHLARFDQTTFLLIDPEPTRLTNTLRVSFWGSLT